MAQKLMTPGVYIEEVNAFPGSVVEVATAVPAFIGYTEKADRNGKTLLKKPTRITSFAEYRGLFGGAFDPKFKLDAITDGKIADGSIPKHEMTINSEKKAINYLPDHDSYMYRGIELFFNNGGGTCYIVSVGTYGDKDKVEVIKEELEGGLDPLLKEQEPTMIVIPDVVRLKDDGYDVYKKVLAHCAKMQSRIAILDIYNGDEARVVSTDPKEDIITNFRVKIGTEYLNYAAAYYPWLDTNIVQKGDITFDNLDVSVDLYGLLPKEEVKAKEIVDNFPLDKETFIKAIIKDKGEELEAALIKDKKIEVSTAPEGENPADKKIREQQYESSKLKIINDSLNNFRDTDLKNTKEVVLNYLKDDAVYRAAIIKEKRADLETVAAKDDENGFKKAKGDDTDTWNNWVNGLLTNNKLNETQNVILKYFVSNDDLINLIATADNQSELETELKKDIPDVLKDVPDDKKLDTIKDKLKTLPEVDNLTNTKNKVLDLLKANADFKTKLKENKRTEIESAIDLDNKKITNDPDKIEKADTSNLENFLDKSLTKIETKNLIETNKLWSSYISNKKRNYHLSLVASSPTYVKLLDEIRAVMNLLPPSSAMAGIYTMVDNNRGVWKSPANISLNSVIKPSANITHDEQEDLNIDAMTGKSINAIRTFPGIGTLVWGARTLDGNSLDWQYINVRRTMIMLEQSIKLALRSYVFEPNDSNTWVTVKSMLVNFLTEKWKQGALAGASPEDAFDVQVGLGATMTSLDILEGKMLVSVKLAIVRPAEFIVVTFEQQMQKS